MIFALAAIVAAGIALTHLLDLRRVPPVTAILLWLSALALRALASVFAIVYLLWFAPETSVFDVLTHWCWHTFVPLLSGDHGLEGHNVGDVALLLPAIALGASLLWIGVRTARVGRAARGLVGHHALGHGPRGSVIVGGPEVSLAVAGLARPRIVVSAGALASLDDDELAAALDHEQAHIARHHRFVMLLALGLRTVGGAIPGSGRALRELGFHLERDADTWTVQRRHDRLALASAICKAATTAMPGGSAALSNLGGAGVRERVRQLLEDEPTGRALPMTVAINGLAIGMLACTLLVAAVVPTAAVAGAGQDAHHGHHGHHCEHGVASDTL
jgi:hypothetical protein